MPSCKYLRGTVRAAQGSITRTRDIITDYDAQKILYKISKPNGCLHATDMAAFFRFYQKSFDTRPYTTLVCANATLGAIGDAAAQTAQITVGSLQSTSNQL
jgi:hypothetical protein